MKLFNITKPVKIILAIFFICYFDVHVIEANNQLKVLFVVGFFPSGPGAAILNQITGLIDRGIDVRIFARHLRKLDTFGTEDIVQKYKMMDILYLKTIPDDLESYDIVYAQSGESGEYFTPILQTLKKRPLFITCFRGADITRYISANPGAFDDLFKIGDAFFPVCNFFKDLLIKNGCSEHKIYVHHSAIDCNLFSYKERSKIDKRKPVKLLSVARIIPKKGLEYAIRAVADSIKKGYKIDYTIIGRGPLKNFLNELIISLDMQKYIRLIGFMPLQEIPQFLNAADIFILPSIEDERGNQEGIPNSLKEAMACGLLTISTYNAGINELINHDKSGLLVKPRNTEELAKAIQYLIDHQEKWQSISHAARLTIEKEYEREIINDRLLYLFDHLLKTAKATS